jgi:hypothetical protein
MPIDRVTGALRVVSPGPGPVFDQALDYSQIVDELVDKRRARAVTMSEALCKLATVTLAIGFELHQVLAANATVSANTVAGYLATIKKLVQVSTAHPELSSSLSGRVLTGLFDQGKVGAIECLAGERQQQVAQFARIEATRKLG